MLLSVERPVVGASAIGPSRATLLHRNGLVQAVLPSSGWIMSRESATTHGHPGGSSETDLASCQVMFDRYTQTRI